MRYESYDNNGREIKIPIAESYGDCWILIKSDFYRWSGKDESRIRILKSVIKPYEYSVLFWLRLSQYRGFWGLLCRLMYKRACRKTHVRIPLSTKIGYGFYIGHGICMVINCSVIGNNVNLSQFLNIGTNRNTPAIIGDNVYIGPQVCLVEDVKIGNNSTIGAGAVVTKDVPEGATVAGVPAKVLNFNNPGRFVERRWPISVSL